MTTLHTAAYTGDMAAVHRFLKDKDLDINKKSLGATTALMFAALRKHWAVMELLIERGADINMVDDTGKDVLSILCGPKICSNIQINPPAIIDTETIECATWALDHGARPDPIRHRNILWVFYRNLAIVERMLKITPMLIENKNVLCAAASRNDWKMLQLLFQHGADPTTKDATGRSLLQLATTRYKAHSIIQTALNSLWLDTIARTRRNQWPAGTMRREVIVEARSPDPDSVLQQAVRELNADMLGELASYLN